LIFNLVEYLKVNLPTLTFVCNGWIEGSSETSINVTQTGGEPQHFFDRTDWTVQIMSRAKTNVDSKVNIESVYSLLKNKYGLTLPTVTVDSVIYAEIKTYQISPLQIPEYLGMDEKRLYMWVFNLKVVTK